MNHQYTAYGLNFSSAFPLPELVPNEFSNADINIRYGEVPEELPYPSAFGALWQADKDKMLLPIKNVARYMIVNNSEVIIERLPDTTEEEVRIFLLGSILGALLHTREMLVLHSSVIETERGAVLFTGKSGAGKSTLLAEFLKRGYPMIADDKAGIIIENKIAKVLPAFPFARITKETVENLKLSVESSRLSSGLKKFVVPVDNFCGRSTPVYAVYSLNLHNKDEIKIDHLADIEKFHTLNKRTYRRRFLQNSRQKQIHFNIVSLLSKQIKVAEVFRPDNTKLIEELADRIEEDFK